jgi:hypothetical protein
LCTRGDVCGFTASSTTDVHPFLVLCELDIVDLHSSASLQSRCPRPRPRSGVVRCGADIRVSTFLPLLLAQAAIAIDNASLATYHPGRLPRASVAALTLCKITAGATACRASKQFSQAKQVQACTGAAHTVHIGGQQAAPREGRSKKHSLRRQYSLRCSGSGTSPRMLRNIP